MASKHPRAFRFLGATLVAAALVALTPVVASAQDCKAEVTASSEPSSSRTLGAFPGSLFAWKAKAKKDAGDAYDTWLRAQAKRIDCKQAAGKWVCTRSAKPCATTATSTKLAAFDPKGPDICLTSPRTKGGEVELLQRYLILTGAKIQPDGEYGSGSAAAVRAFQKLEGLDTNKKDCVDRATKQRLMEEVK